MENMATMDRGIETGGVPVREGDYGERVVAVEPGGIEYIPARERHGRPIDLVWTWMSPNLEFATIYVGVIPIAVFGGAFWSTVVALTIGIALGSLTHGILSTWGPRFGVPQLVQSRAAFGYVGNILPAGLQSITSGIGWYAVNSVSASFALQSLFKLLGWAELPFWLALLVVVLVQVAVAFAGHNMVHRVERILVPYLGIVFALATIFVLAHADPGRGFDAHAPAPFGGPSAAFVLAMTIALGYVIGWNPYASDYTRYLPPDTKPLHVALAAGGGMFVANVVLMTMGAGLATVAGTDFSKSPTDQLLVPLPTWLAALTFLGIAAGGVAANAINIYSSAISFLALGVRWGFRQRRAVVALSTGILGFIVALIGHTSPGGNYENFLLLIAYWITPFLAVVLVDYWLRRGRYDEAIFFDSRHRPWQGAASMLVGIAASVPFWNQALFIGPVPRAIPELGDLSFFVGFVVTAVVYYALTAATRRPLTEDAETTAVEA
jgi:NCS1 family nucleobase:cation symporter-1